MSTTVLFIHGTWLSPAVWSDFAARYAARGQSCLVPPWPLHDRPVEALRREPDPALARLDVGQVVAHFERIARELVDPPILVGHGLGGLVVQVLLDRGLGVAGVAIDTVPPRGILPSPSTLRSALPVLLGWRPCRRVVRMTRSHFRTHVAQHLAPAALEAAFDRLVVPAPGRIVCAAALGRVPAVAWRRASRAPLLLVAGADDRCIPPATVRAAYLRHNRSPAVTAFSTFPGRSHLLIAEPGWEEVADYVLDWAVARVRAAAGFCDL